MPGRKFSATASGYRYGFNGKENDKETTSTTTYDYGFRIYSPALGRFLSVDPLTKSYPELTPYQFASNTPIEAIDLDGLEKESSKKEGFWKGFGKTILRKIDNGLEYVMKNPNHAGYDINPKKLTKEDFKPYETNWSQVLDPTWQIQNVASNVVYGVSNFVGGIIDQDGARTAEGLTQLIAGAGTMYGIASVLKVPTIPMISTRFGLSKLRLQGVANALAASKGDKPYMISAVTDKKTGVTYIGENKAILSLDEVHAELKARLPKESLEKWKTYNCAECDAFNKALNNGAKWEDLGDMHTKQWDRETKSYIDRERCDNCKVTFEDKTPTSEPIKVP